MSYVLLLLAVLFFVLLNGFFVAAEFALVRSRRSKLEQLAEEGSARRGARGEADRAHQRVPVGVPARHHAGLARRSASSASPRSPTCSGRSSASPSRTGRRSRSRSRSPTSSPRRSTSPSASRSRRSTRSSTPRRSRAASRRRAARLLAVMRPAVRLPQQRSRTGSCALLRTDPSAEFEEGRNAEELKLLIAQSRSTAASSTRARRGCSPASSTSTSRRRARS